ncbi:MAG TPA: glycoside hydrolase family 3 C-terminal domain-containing protein [Acidimicrobiales bacterium]
MPQRSLLHPLARLGVVGLITIASLAAALPSAPKSDATTRPRSVTPAHPCPWVGESRNHTASPADLAEQVVAKMTLAEKAQFVTLSEGHHIENFNTGIPSLCIPQLTLSDGPDGLAGRITGATQLPAAIGVAASFDTSLADATGQLVGQEAKAKGLDVVQGPELNLARVPLDGRIFESFGEDPFLTSALGVANIEGIQSTGAMALAKHLTAYSQETARARIDDDVTPRALAELYNAPFEAAVKDAHVAALMCSSGLLNGVAACASPYVYDTLKSWGFTGFVRSDLRAAPHPATAFKAGLDIIKPTSAAFIEKIVRTHVLAVSDLNRAVRLILGEMFTYGLIAHPRDPNVDTLTSSSAHNSVALRAAEESVVLLKNTNDALPLSSTSSSIAVIGVDASTSTVNTGFGSSRVVPPFLVTPLKGIDAAASKKTNVTYTPGGPNSVAVGRLENTGVITQTPQRVPPGSGLKSQLSNDDLSIEAASNVTNAVITASQPGTGRGWSHWSAVFHAKMTGSYEIAVREIGDTWFSMNGHEILGSSGLHEPVTMTTVVHLQRGHPYKFTGTWFTVIHKGPPEFGIADVTPDIDAAVTAARHANVAVVFAGKTSTEGADQDNLVLPGDENALISAVAAANPHTIVVLNTGGPVLMPWLDSVRGVLEAWYPGQEDGTAIAAILFGAVDPSGRLPVTFPTSLAAQPVSMPTQFPGVNDIVSFGTGTAALDVGYRWYEAHDVTPLFPFGYGLDYTSFSLSDLHYKVSGDNIALTLNVSNTGTRSGVDVLQTYVKDPAKLDEPPEQLKAFVRVNVEPGASRTVALSIPISSLSVYVDGGMRTLAGTYGVSIGQSSANLPLTVQVKITSATADSLNVAGLRPS